MHRLCLMVELVLGEVMLAVGGIAVVREAH